MKSTITITYGENVENHAGNQQIGSFVDHGISTKDLKTIQKALESQKYKCKYIDLMDLLNDKQKKDIDFDAGVLVVENFVNTLFNDKKSHDMIFDNLKKLVWDKKCVMRGRVVNKIARWNLCFADFAQNPNYDEGKGRVYKFSDLKYLQKIREFINNTIGHQLNAEGNYYYDLNKCYIGYHGDTERKIVVGIRFGDDFPLEFKWFHNSDPVTKSKKIIMNGGDLYIMSEKAVGFDWKKRSQLTLRHCAGYNV